MAGMGAEDSRCSNSAVKMEPKGRGRAYHGGQVPTPPPFPEVSPPRGAPRLPGPTVSSFLKRGGVTVVGI